MKVHKLFIQHIKGIREVKIYAKQHVNEVAGPNESGKTTLLDAIKWAFGGKKAMDGKPVSNGESQGRIWVETDDGLIINQKVRDDGKVTVSIKDKDGGIHGQSKLNASFDKLSFDPLAFSTMKHSDRIQLIENFAGPEFLKKREDIQTQIENVFEQRRMHKRLLGALGELTPVEEVSPVDIEALVTEGQDIDLYNRECRQHKAKRSKVHAELVDSETNEHRHIQNIDRLKQEIKDIEERIVLEEKYVEKFQKEQRHIKTLLDELGESPVPQDRSDIDRQLSESAEVNRRAQAYKDYCAKTEDADSLKAKIQTASDTLDFLRESLNDHVASVELPIKGLSFDGKEIFVYGIPWDQLSKSQKIQYSAHMGIELNKDLKVMFVYDGSLLDEERLQILTDIVQSRDYQLWIETVGDGRTEDAIILEAGEVKGAKEEESLDDRAV